MSQVADVGPGARAGPDPELSADRDAERSWSIGLLSVDIYFFWASLYLFVPILSVYAKALGASLSMVGLIIGSYGLTQLIVRIPMGMLSDRLGRRKPFVTLAFVMTGISVLGLAWSPNPTWLLVFRGLTGLSAATWVTTTVLYSSYFAHERSVRAISFATFFQGVAMVMATAAGGALADAYGWTSTFYLALIPAGLGVLLSLFLIEDVTVREPRPFSWVEFKHMRGIGLLLIVSALACVTQYANYATTFGFVPIYGETLGASPTQLGWLSTAVLLPYALAALASARLADRVGERVLLTGGLVIMGLTSAGIPFINSVPVLIGSRVLYGIGAGLSFPVMMGLSIKHIDSEHRALAMGFFQAVYAVGMFLGPTLSGVLADVLGMGGMFYIVGVLCLGAAVVTVRLLQNSRNDSRSRVSA